MILRQGATEGRPDRYKYLKWFIKTQGFVHFIWFFLIVLYHLIRWSLLQFHIENKTQKLEECFVKCIWPADNWDNEGHHSNDQQSWIDYFKWTQHLDYGPIHWTCNSCKSVSNPFQFMNFDNQFLLTNENAEFESYSFAFFATISFVITRIATICTNLDIVYDIDDNRESDLKMFLR